MAKKANKLPVAKPSTVEVAQPYKRTKEDEARERRYRAEDALRTIKQADEYTKDKQLMSDVKKLAQEQVNSLKKFC